MRRKLLILEAGIVGLPSPHVDLVACQVSKTAKPRKALWKMPNLRVTSSGTRTKATGKGLHLRKLWGCRKEGRGKLRSWKLPSNIIGTKRTARPPPLFFAGGAPKTQGSALGSREETCGTLETFRTKSLYSTSE